MFRDPPPDSDPSPSPLTRVPPLNLAVWFSGSASEKLLSSSGRRSES